MKKPVEPRSEHVTSSKPLTDEYRSKMNERRSFSGKCRVSFKNSIGTELWSVEPTVERVKENTKDITKFLMKIRYLPSDETKKVPRSAEKVSYKSLEICGWTSLVQPLEVPFYSLYDLTQLDQEIYRDGKISVGKTCSEGSVSSIRFNVTMKKSDSQKKRERTWLKREKESSDLTKLMWDCKRKMDLGYVYSTECYRLWNTFTELHRVEMTIEPKIKKEHVFPAMSALLPYYKKAVAYWHSWNIKGLQYKYSTKENSKIIDPKEIPSTIEMLNMPKNYKFEKSPERDNSWSLSIRSNETDMETLYRDVRILSSEMGPVAFMAPKIWQSIKKSYLLQLTAGRYPASCVHHKESVSTFDSIFYTSPVLNENEQSYLLSGDCSSDSRFALYHKRVGQESRKVTLRLLNHVITVVPTNSPKSSGRLSKSSEENIVKVLVDGKEMPVKEQESIYIPHDDKMYFLVPKYSGEKQNLFFE